MLRRHQGVVEPLRRNRVDPYGHVHRVVGKSGEPRPCDYFARDKLSPKRHNSVFPVSVYAAVCQESHEDAKISICLNSPHHDEPDQ